MSTDVLVGLFAGLVFSAFVAWWEGTRVVARTKGTKALVDRIGSELETPGTVHNGGAVCIWSNRLYGLSGEMIDEVARWHGYEWSGSDPHGGGMCHYHFTKKQ